MGPIWKSIYAAVEEYRSAGVPRYECGKRAVIHMTRAQAIEALNEAIETVKEYIQAVRAILGSKRDPECNAQIATYNKYVHKYQKELKLYREITDERFRSIFPTLLFRDIASDLYSMELACFTLVGRGPRYNPPR